VRVVFDCVDVEDCNVHSGWLDVLINENMQLLCITIVKFSRIVMASPTLPRIFRTQNLCDRLEVILG